MLFSLAESRCCPLDEHGAPAFAKHLQNLSQEKAMKKILSPKLLPVALALAVPLCASAQTTSTTTSPDSDYRWGSKFLLDYEHLTPTEH
ncbi:MAG TPA: hypothetical protein VFW00_13685, partial [Rhodocyclaceae bacterium]|nr:hypothetical protein [Rhodocyclaceae bacterium]